MKMATESTTERGPAPRRTPWLLMLAIAGCMVVRDLDALDMPLAHAEAAQDAMAPNAKQAAAVEQGSLLRKVSLLAACVVAALSLVRNGMASRAVPNGVAVLLIAYTLLACLSLLWTADPGLAGRRVTTLLMLEFVAFAMAMRLGWRDLILFAMLTTGTLLSVGLAAEIVHGTFHPLRGGYRLAGTMHPNSQAMNCGLLALASCGGLFTLPPGRRALRGLCAGSGAMATVCLLLTGSRTGVFAFLVSLALVIAMLPQCSLRRCLPWLAGGASAALLALLLGGVLVGEDLASRLHAGLHLGREEESSGAASLNGRGPLWAQCVQYAMEKPILGYGYEAFWTPERILEISYEQTWSIQSAHNSYLQSLLNLGMVGAVLFVSVVIFAWLRLGVSCRREEGREAVSLGFGFGVISWLALISLLEAWVPDFSPSAFLPLVVLFSTGFCLQSAPATLSVRPRSFVPNQRGALLFPESPPPMP